LSKRGSLRIGPTSDRVVAMLRTAGRHRWGRVDQFLHRFEGKIGVAEMSIDLCKVKNEVSCLPERGCFSGTVHRFGVLTSAGYGRALIINSAPVVDSLIRPSLA
jgi:hypothetical protein